MLKAADLGPQNAANAARGLAALRSVGEALLAALPEVATGWGKFRV